MPSILGFVVNEAIHSANSHPPLDSKCCLNSKQGRLTCSACVDICPAGVLIDPKKGKADWEKCINCGLCASVCPSGAMGFADYRLSKAQRMLTDGRNIHILGCPQASGEMDSKVWCLGSYPWELIAALALVGRVELLRGDCTDCPRREKLACFEAAMDRARRFLGDDRFEQQISLREMGEPAKKEVTRRELFGKFLPGMNRSRLKAMDKPAEEKPRAQTMRQLLLDILERLEDQEEKFVWQAPDFSRKCWACGICTKVCPNDALKVREKEGVWRVVCSPAKCTSCGVCAAVCMEGAIAGMKELKLAAHKRRVVFKTEARCCSSCGAAVKPDSEFDLCIRCRAIQKKKK